METPTHLTPAAADAFGLAVDHLGDDAPVFADAILRYANAVDLAERIRIDWIDRGSPMFLEHTNGALYEHPLVKQMRGAEREAATFAKALKITPDSESWAATNRRAGKRQASAREAAYADAFADAEDVADPIGLPAF
jgi:phage terminase small subunit